LKFDGQSGTWLNKSKTNDQTGKGTKIEGLKLTESGAKLRKLEVYWSIEGQIAQIQNQGLKWKRWPTSGQCWNLARMQLNWFLNQNCN